MNNNEKTNDNNNSKINKEENSNNKSSIKARTDKIKTAKHALRYAIAGLSLVSFFTTSSGLKNVVPSDDKIVPYLISFGIQVLVLIVGTELVNIVKKINKIDSTKFVRKLVVIAILIPYISSVGFSSFFSYVFLSNEAYAKVRETDYNIKIENFLSEEIGELDNLNDAAGRVILAKVQEYVPEFKDTLNQFLKNADNEMSNIRYTLVFNDKDSIDSSIYFNATNVIDRIGATSEQEISLREIESIINNIANDYSLYYSYYLSDYNNITNSTTDNIIESLDSRLESIQNNINMLTEKKDSLDNITDINEKFVVSIRQSSNAVKTYYINLIMSYNNLLSVYNQIKNNNAIEYADANISEIYNIIYSTVNIDTKDIENATAQLQNIIVAYLETTESEKIDDSMLQNLSACITYLGEFQKYKNLSNNIDVFEDSVLNQVYVIDYDMVTEEEQSDKNNIKLESKNDSDIVEQKDTINVNYVSRDEWNEIRRKDLGEFINLVKSLPSFETIINTSNNSSTELRVHIKTLEDNKKYRTKTLDKAYKINRQNLEGISEIERARNYFYSDFRYMAIYCLFVSLFLDLSSFFVGMFFYFTNDNKENRPSEVHK